MRNVFSYFWWANNFSKFRIRTTFMRSLWRFITCKIPVQCESTLWHICVRWFHIIFKLIFTDLKLIYIFEFQNILRKQQTFGVLGFWGELDCSTDSWCKYSELNREAFLRKILSLLCLPVSPYLLLVGEMGIEPMLRCLIETVLYEFISLALRPTLATLLYSWCDWQDSNLHWLHYGTTL